MTIFFLNFFSNIFDPGSIIRQEKIWVKFCFWLEIPQFVFILVESPVFVVVLEIFPESLRSIEVL